MMNNKKGVELSMNVIIIAAIGLLVLIILAVLVINSSGRLQRGISESCATKGGTCKVDCGANPIITASDPSVYLCDNGYQCCSVFNTDSNI